MPDQPIFKTSQERDAWLTAHADYFTVIFRRWRRNNRIEFKTLASAEKGAQKLLKIDPTLRLMIYAVKGVHDCWVKTIKKEGK